MQKTKWQEILDKPKGAVDYNPSQTFALHVYWVVRSPRAAMEMIERGFKACAHATQRDTPTTICYLFRISRDQTKAHLLKQQVKTIGQHPHYQPIFKSMKMGLSQAALESKLKLGGIDVKPLTLAEDEPIEIHQKDLDFDPVVLECTEIYLDNQSFYEHSASHEWMKNSPEILKACRSLKATTYCLGSPDEKIWESTLESSLKAIRFDHERTWAAKIQPAVTVLGNESKISIEKDYSLYFLEFDVLISSDTAGQWRKSLDAVQSEYKCPYMIVLPKNMDEGDVDILDVRVMMTFCFKPANTNGKGLKQIKTDSTKGRLYVFSGPLNEAERFIRESELDIVVENANSAISDNHLAGYALHPLFHQLVSNTEKQYQLI